MRQRLLLLPCALFCLAAAAPVKAPLKPVSPKVAPAPATPNFDIQNPQTLIDLLTLAGAKAQIAHRDSDAVFVTASSTVAAFSMQFAGCSAQGRACRAMLLDHTLEHGQVTLPQLNQFNQTSVMCRLYQDHSGFQHVVYSTVLFRSDNRADAAVHLQAWQGCITDARDFEKDPVAYLANAA